jgi:hypothetical protein
MRAIALADRAEIPLPEIRFNPLHPFDLHSGTV